MKEDKISTCLKNWHDIQEGRLSKLKMHRVRVDEKTGSYYGRVHVTKYSINIIADDVNKDGKSLDELHITGVNKTPKTITLNLVRGESLTIHFKSIKAQKITLSKVRRLVGEESTSESEEHSESPPPEGAAEN